MVMRGERSSEDDAFKLCVLAIPKEFVHGREEIPDELIHSMLRFFFILSGSQSHNRPDEKIVSVVSL